MILSGFLAPDGSFVECKRWAHLPTAEQIAHDVYAQRALEGIQAEEYLLDHGYVIFYPDGVRHCFVSKHYGIGRALLLTAPQKDFIVKHLSGANNSEQQREMEKILLYDMEYREDSILSRMEDKFLSYQI